MPTTPTTACRAASPPPRSAAGCRAGDRGARARRRRSSALLQREPLAPGVGEGELLDRAPDAETEADSSLELGLSRAVQIADWELSAGATWTLSRELDTGGAAQDSHGLDLEFDLTTARFWHGTLGLEGETSFSYDAESGIGPLAEASISLTYDLQF